MIIYLIPILIYLISKGTKNKINFTSLSIFLILALRDNIGYDFQSYIAAYELKEDNYELISKYLTQFTFIFKNYHYFFLTFAFLTIFFVRKAAQISNNHFLIILFILFPGFFIDSFSTVRQSLAISLVIYSYALNMNMKNYYYMPLIISCLVHYSAIPFALCFLFINFFSKNKFLFFYVLTGLVILSSSILLVVENVSILFPRINYYVGDNDFGNKLFLFFLIISSILFKELYKSNWKGFNLIICGLVLYMSLQQLDSVFLRVTTYFFVPFLFLEWSFPILKIRKYSLVWVIPLTIVYIYLLDIKTYDYNLQGSMIPYKTYIRF